MSAAGAGATADHRGTVRWTWLTTADGERLRARYLPGAGNVAVVLAHGVTGRLDKPAVLTIAAELTPYASVVSLDLRGHGRSTGVSTVGDAEVLDIDAAVGWARSLGHDRVVSMGFSMGAPVVLRHAALAAGATGAGPDLDRRLVHRVDAVVAVSGPSHWFYRGTTSMRRLNLVLEHRLGRAMARRVMRTRITSTGWDGVLPLSPASAAARLDVPLLVVHGDADHYFPVEHAERVAAAAAGSVRLWVEPGMRHAEEATTPDLVRRIGAYLPELLAAASHHDSDSGAHASRQDRSQPGTLGVTEDLPGSQG